MRPDDPTELALLKSILEPLLEDFLYWFERAQVFMEKEDLTFLTSEEKQSLLQRFKQSHEEVKTARILYQATDGKAGIETSIMVPWHHLVAEYWQLASQWRRLQSQENS